MKLTFLESDLDLRRREQTKYDSLDDLSDYYVASRRSGMPNPNDARKSSANPIARQAEKLTPQNVLLSRVQESRRAWQTHDIDSYTYALIAPDGNEITVHLDDGTVTAGDAHIGDMGFQALQFIIGDVNAQGLTELEVKQMELETEGMFWDELNSIYARHLAGYGPRRPI